MISFSPT